MLFVVCTTATLSSVAQTAPQMAQYPSPMKEIVRRHERIAFDTKHGTVITLDIVLPKPVVIYLSRKIKKTKKADLLIHFHGSGNIVAFAAEKYKGNLIAVTVNLGSGSGVYSDVFKNDSAFALLEGAIWNTVAAKPGATLRKGNIILSGFSAGYGAIRSILSRPEYFSKVNAVLLLDGLHTSYIPERKVLADGGSIDSAGLMPFIHFAKESADQLHGKKFLFTHSEIFPGTFVSTTEAAEYLLKELQMKTAPVLKWGPGGMQQISEASKGNCKILGFAGNSAPDHVDHLQGLYYFLNKL
ncbi:hypothetical protein [Niabella aquatica]